MAGELGRRRDRDPEEMLWEDRGRDWSDTSRANECQALWAVVRS